VSSAGEKLYVPMSAFIDLGNPKSVRIDMSGSVGSSSFMVTILGGDAGSAYEAKLAFSTGWLRERVVRHLEFPEAAWERTEFHFNTLNN
jgi:hypothetical protein